jgi:hypothetical protein
LITDIQTVRIADLIDAGVISPQTKIRGVHGSTVIEATIKKDGTLVCRAMSYSSPSVAAGQSITAISGRKSPGRNYLSINGWTFWKVAGHVGSEKTLADLRREFFDSQQPLALKV